MPTQQLPLGVSLRDDATFDNYFIAGGGSHPNRNVTQTLQKQIRESESSFVFFWGSSGCGVTHLLQASCHYAETNMRSSQFLSLKDCLDYPANDVLEGMEQFDVLCLDDVQCVIGHSEWEQALFNIMNRVREQQGRLLMGANSNPLHFSTDRDDLRSRFAWGAVFQIQPLDDDGKKAALQMRAKARGLSLNEDVARYILNRAPRDTTQLFSMLDQLDKTSLEAQRKLTIPFVKSVIG